MNLEKDWYRNEFLQQEVLEKHRMMEEEFSFYNAIATGNIDYLEENFKECAFSNPEGMGHLSDRPLQNLRYHFIITTAMTTRYCVNAGLEQEKAYNLSDFYIQKMDKCSKIEEITKLHDIMCLDFCKKMLSLRNSQILSKPIVLCMDYIYSHIHCRITLKDLSSALNLSQSYLSKLFSKEMGISISEYILDLKIGKAKNMLQYSDFSIVDISNYLAFSSQSHFIQTFQKKVGTTPHKYRVTYFRSAWPLSGLN